MTRRTLLIPLDNGETKEIHVKVSKRGIKVTNSIDSTVYVSSYFSLNINKSLFKDHLLYRLQDPIKIEPNETVEVERTSHKCFSCRKPLIIFTRELHLLEIQMPRHSSKQLGHKHIFISKSEKIVFHQGLLTTESQIHGDTFFDGDVESLPVVVRSSPLQFSNTSLQIVYRRGQYITSPMPIGPKEKATFDLRRKNIRESLSKYLGEELKEDCKVPNISICFSGGSYRAMLGTLGFLKGIQDISLFDCISYMVGLSGSCWALALWYTTFRRGYDSMIKELDRKLARGIRDSYTDEVKKFVKQLDKERKEQDLPKTKMVDLYQGLVANQLFDDLVPSGYTYDFAHLREYCNFEEGKLPIPIFTAVFKEPHNYEWLEITPFEVGSQYLGGYIPTEKFGCYFQQGKIVHESPNLKLSRIMSFACSVQCLTIYRLLMEVVGPDLSSEAPDVSLAEIGEILVENEMGFLEKLMLDDSSEMDDHSDSENHTTNSKVSLLDSESKAEKKIRMKEEKEKKKKLKNIEKLQKKEAKKNAPSTLSKLVKKTANIIDNSQRLSDKYLIRPATFPNFTFGLDGSPTKHKKFLKLVDGGFDFCIPFPPVLLQDERIPDVLIIVEMSSTPLIEIGGTLQASLKWVHSRGIKFPPIDAEKLKLPFPDNLPYVIFRDENDPTVPVVVYVVMQKFENFSDEFDPIQNMREGGFCNTFNYKFTPPQIHQISGVMEEIAKSLDPAMKELLRDIIHNSSE